MSYSCTVNNIHFDKVFMQEVAKSKAKTFGNGIPLQLVLTFKTISCLPDGQELNTQVIREWYHKFFGVVISLSSISRNVSDLHTLGFVERVVNPFENRRLSWIKLTPTGRRLQKLFIGTTSDWKDVPKLKIENQLKTARSIKI